MSVEWYAPVVLLVSAAMWIFGGVLGSVIAMLFFTLFGGGAALILGHATVQPVELALVLTFAHLLLSMFRRSGHANLGLKVNGYLAFFCLYGAVTAYILPRVFARAMEVPPLLMNGQHDFYVQNALRFTSQNLTTGAYLLGTMIASIAASAAADNPASRRMLVTWGVIISWIHVFFGIAGAVLTNVGGAAIISFFRNATYAELVQTTAGGYSRLSGVFPEPSAYAGYAFGWFVFMAELWLRDVSPRLTMITAAGLGFVLIACTSTTGYAALAVYALILMARFAVAPRSFPLAKAIPVALILLAGVCAVLAVMAFLPHVAMLAGRALAGLTVGKADSASGQQRLYWAAAGLKAFVVSWGLGIGAGSFRCSSLLLAILGSMGVVGVVAFTAHFLKILEPLNRKTYALPGDPREAIAVSAAWAACVGLVPALLAAPTPDPSIVFAVMGGMALGWRYLPARRPAPAVRPELGRRLASVGAPPR